MINAFLIVLQPITNHLVSTFTLILLSLAVDRDTTQAVTNFAVMNHIPLICIQSVGFYSRFEITLPPIFPIVDTHPDSTSTTDLRLLTPWPELSRFAAEKTKDLEKQSDHDHGHVPYLLLLLYYLEKWKEQHDGKVPANYKEKSEFREFVRKGARANNVEGTEENYDEAIAAVLKTITQPSLSNAVSDIFQAP